MLKPSLPTRSQWPSLLTLGAVNIALFFAFIFIMAVNLPAAIAGVGMVSVPVVALLYAWLAKGQRPAKVQAFCAMALVVLAWLLFDPAYVALNVLGVAALFGALLTIVIGSTLVQSLSVHIHWWVVLTWQLIIGGSLLLLAAFIDGSVLNPEQYHVVFEPISALQYTALFWLIVPNTAIAYTLYVWLLGRMSVAEFSFGTIANPIAGIVCAVVLINEQYQDWQYLLMFLMIIFSVLPQMLKLRLLKQQTS